MLGNTQKNPTGISLPNVWQNGTRWKKIQLSWLSSMISLKRWKKTDAFQTGPLRWCVACGHPWSFTWHASPEVVPRFRPWVSPIIFSFQPLNSVFFFFKFSPEIWGNDPNWLLHILFKWVGSTTKKVRKGQSRHGFLGGWKTALKPRFYGRFCTTHPCMIYLPTFTIKINQM